MGAELRNKMKVTTPDRDKQPFYFYLTEREQEFRASTRPLRLNDVIALGSHSGEFEISEEELDALVESAPRVIDTYDSYGERVWGTEVHHKVWMGKWEFGVTWDRKLVYAKEVHSNPEPTGTCYTDAWRFLMKQDAGFLIHGSVQLSSEGPRVNHAWVELSTGWVWEPQTGQYFIIEDFKIMSPIEDHRYTSEEAALLVVKTMKHGPWSDEERLEWLREPD